MTVTSKIIPIPVQVGLIGPSVSLSATYTESNVPNGTLRFYNGTLNVYDHGVWYDVSLVGWADIPTLSSQIDTLIETTNNISSDELKLACNNVVKSLRDLQILVDIHDN